MSFQMGVGVQLESRLVWGLASRNSKCSMSLECTKE